MKWHTIYFTGFIFVCFILFFPIKSLTVQAKSGLLEENNNDEFINIGPQVHQATALISAFGRGPDNTPYMYIIQHGSPSALSVYNLISQKVEQTLPLEYSTSAWGIDVDSRQNVWIGGTSEGYLYRYIPGTRTLENFGNQLYHSRDTTIQDIHASGGKIFGSTAYNGSVFSFDPLSSTQTNYGQLLKGKEFAKSIQYDPHTQSIFAGLGSKAELVRYNIKTNEKNRFFPWNYRFEKSVSDIKLAGDYLFAHLDPSPKILVFNKKTLQMVDELNVSSKGVSAKSPVASEVYFTNSSKLYSYNYETKKISESKGYLNAKAAISLDFVKFNTVEYPGYTLVGLLTNQGDYFKYNLQTGKFVMEKINLAELPVTLYTMSASPSKEKILINGFMSGGLGIYDVLTGITTEVKGISQIESIAFYNNKVYFGGYPKARVMEFDITMPWRTDYIKEILRFKDIGQDRTTAMIGVEDVKKIFIGTYPETGVGGGILSVYDPDTKENIVYENYIPDQSIISFAYLNGYVYGSTTIFANHTRSKEPAALFRFKPSDPANKELINLPLQAAMIDSLQHDNKENIWAMADGKLFNYNITTGLTKSIEIVPAISGRFKNAKLLYSDDKMLYGTVEGVLFKADPLTLQYTILKKEGAYDLTIDHKGSLYFRNDESLWRYSSKTPQSPQQ